MANPRDTKKIPITWTTVGGTDYSQVIKCNDFRDVGITAVGSGDIIVLASKEKRPDESPVDFTITSTIDNAYASVVIADETTPNTYVNTINPSGGTILAEVNTNLVTFICLTRSRNTVDAYISVCDNS